MHAFLNPIIPGFNPDPTILRTGNDYFVATSSFEFLYAPLSQSSLDYPDHSLSNSPGVPIYHSTDLYVYLTCDTQSLQTHGFLWPRRIKWDVIGHALNRPSQLNMRGTAPSGGIYAPTLRYHASTRTYYLITTWFDIISPPDNVTRLPRSMYVHSKDIWDDDAWRYVAFEDVMDGAERSDPHVVIPSMLTSGALTLIYFSTQTTK